MATLTYTVSIGDWSATINLNYSTSYEPSNNSTSITFSNCTVSYISWNGYESNSTTTITLTTSDNEDSSGEIILTTLEDGSGVTGATKTYTATTETDTATLTHKSIAGEKKINISAVTAMSIVPSSSSSTRYYPSNSENPATSSVTSTTLYTFHKSVSPGVKTSTITNTSNGYVVLNDKSLIHSGSILQMWRAADTGYTLTEAHFGGGGIVDNGATYKITGDTTVTISAEVNSYSLTLTPDANSSILVNRTSSPLKGASTGNLATGSTIYYSDVLLITFSANSGYEIATSTVNDLNFVSGDSHTVDNNVTVKVISKSMGVVYIDNGSTIEKYLVYVDNGSSWDQYIPYVDDGSGWNICS